MTTETDIQNAIRIAATDVGARLFRNQVGLYKLEDGRRISSGLCTGSSDLIGWTPRIIGGAKVAIFTAIEVKRPGQKPKPHQRIFLDCVTEAGGIAGYADSVESAIEILIGSDCE